MTHEPSHDKGFSRREFLRLAALGVATLAGSGILGSELANTLRLLAELRGSGFSPDIPLPKKQEEEIQGIVSLATKVSTTIEKEESVRVENMDIAHFTPILVAQTWGYSVVRDKYHNPESYEQWVHDEAYPLPEHHVEIVGDDKDSKEYARRILDAYVTNDQSRISAVLLEQNNESGPYHNTVRWEIGRYPLDLWRKTPEVMRAIQKSFIHELSHAGTPFHPVVKIGDKLALIPYGFTRSMEFIKGWLTAIQTDYPFFQSRFFLAEGDGTLSLVQEGELGAAIDEFMAMLVTDMVFPGDSVHTLPETTKAHVLTSLGYIRHGVKGGSVTDRDVLELQKNLEGLLKF